jgi:polysaccharide export outer membrane protein
VLAVVLIGIAAAACARGPVLPAAEAIEPASPSTYRVGPGDMLRVFVWGNPGLSDTVPVRPDGKISLPLLEDLVVIDKTPSELGREIEDKLSAFVEEPLVTVIVTEFVGPLDQQVRVVGEASEPRAIPFRTEMTMLDVMIEVGGLTEFAAGNRTTLVRQSAGEQRQFRVRLGDLVRGGDVSANFTMRPGDVVIIPETYF